MNYRESAENIFMNIGLLRKQVILKGVDDISKGEMAILGYLNFAHDGATAGELSEVTCVVSSRIAAVLNSLEKKGYAMRKTDLKDKRKVQVYITEEGRMVVARKYEEVITAVEKSLSLLGEEDTLALMRILEKLTKNEKYTEMYHTL